MPEDIIVIKIEDPEEKADIVRTVLLDLPDWFGLPESNESYIRDSKSFPLWAAQRDREVIGFIALKETSPETAEIHCMGIKKACHRQGIGTQLFRVLEKHAREKYRYLQVKTVEEGNYPEYDQTVAFYRSVGFSKLEVFPTLWDESNPCLIMVKVIS